jgi:uncharacterized protein (DUF1684 family)
MRALPSAIFVLSLALSGCSPPPDPSHVDVATWRANKDEFMRSSADSPVPPEQRGSFKPLNYYAVDPAYQVPASLTVNQSSATDVLQMPTSTGQFRQMRRIGTLSFTLKGEPLTLTAFIDASEQDMRRLFVPFGDLTNGAETYHGGRYLDLDRTATGIYDLDFNRAYFPFCYYNPSYDCPVPPKENRLAVPVRAGERMDAAAR